MDKILKAVYFALNIYYFVWLSIRENDEARENRLATSEGACFARSSGETETRWIL